MQKIKDVYGKVLFTSKTANTIKKAVEEAIEEKISLWRADLRGADLRGAALRGADLWGANLREANLREANLWEANLWGANLREADLREANLWGAKSFPTNEIVHRSICPRSGEFIAWKKGKNDSIIKLKIPAWARRISPVIGRKCRAEFAIVIEIESDDGKQLQHCSGWKDSDFKYTVGSIVSPDEYDASPFIECSHGIHFFMTKQEAIDW
jgi:hypothetical protein